MSKFISYFFRGELMKKLKLISPIPPSVNHYLGYRAIMKSGRPMAASYVTAEAKKYKTNFTLYVKDQTRKQGYKMSENPYQHYYVDCVFYFDRTDRDSNNYMKVMLDAITESGCVWIDDNVVCERVQAIYYDKISPRIELEIYPVDYIGIFDNASALKNFENRCVGCVRYTRNCSLLQKAKEGRTQDEIHDGLCLCYRKKGK